MGRVLVVRVAHSTSKIRNLSRRKMYMQVDTVYALDHTVICHTTESSVQNWFFFMLCALLPTLFSCFTFAYHHFSKDDF